MDGMSAMHIIAKEAEEEGVNIGSTDSFISHHTHTEWDGMFAERWAHWVGVVQLCPDRYAAAIL